MPTYARKHQLNTSLIYHIYNRSNGRVAIFNSSQDYLYFIQLLQIYSLKFCIKIYNWVIMRNHYHLLLELAKPEIVSKVMAGIGKSYTNYYHRKYSSSGFLWQGRFKLQPVQEERYLIACARYIERNPIKAGIVKEAQDYPYSSAKFYCLGVADSVTVENPEFISFGLEFSSRMISYSEFLRNFDNEEEKIFNHIETPAGDQGYIRKLLKINGRYLQIKRGKPRKIIT